MLLTTSAQKAALKAHILATPDLAALMTGVGSGDLAGLAALLNTVKAPSVTVWKTNVTITEVGDNMNGTELAGLTSLNVSRLQLIGQYSLNGVNPSLADRRQFFDDVFSGAGGALTRAKFLTLWKRLATRLEALFATGTGSNAVPATLVIEGELNYTELINL